MKIVSSPDQLEHRPLKMMIRGQLVTPVEQSERLNVLTSSLAQDGHQAERPGDHALDPVLQVHDPAYVDFLKQAFAEWRRMPNAGPEVLPNTHQYRGACQAGQPPGRPPAQSIAGQAGWFVSDLTSAIGEGTWTAVAASVRSAMHGAKYVAAGEASVYAACRPPGHHAYVDQAGGFCFLNNAAVAANMLVSTFGRVAIIDFDTHHGDGTQSIFYGRNDVFVGSVHTDPSSYYPFYVGYADERGAGEGHGFNMNIPLAPGVGDHEFVEACDALAKAAAAKGCRALVLSAGWDAHGNDPLSLLKVTDDGYARVAERLAKLALPTLIVQEGGYSLDVIASAPRRFLSAFCSSHKL
ncbi:histone deacetylase family protein [Bradyrhizobium sp. KBS0727]|uniref:histone deacetylase family protein n=1 Tax=unclassified Bradyrhizobium TaxID=2631580 RepID=UPI00110E9CDE|nr:MULTISPECIES: histone deacetylase family protein [unclassified Bradyrhizobium]QDW36879.1 histone deacetylase family protein [Bradyrhizobium sp. KBS0725]QDW43479.1 histone deacetylase family protein [Bradyrhizobium sp. KBS0727]